MPVLITPEGRKKLQDEIDRLWKVERPQVTSEVETAAAHGDRAYRDELAKRTAQELHEELREEIARVETRANGECNDLDAAYLADGTLDPQAMLEAHTQQVGHHLRHVGRIVEHLALQRREFERNQGRLFCFGFIKHFWKQNYVRAYTRGLGIFELPEYLAWPDWEQWDPLLEWLDSRRSQPAR